MKNWIMAVGLAVLLAIAPIAEARPGGSFSGGGRSSSSFSSGGSRSSFSSGSSSRSMGGSFSKPSSPSTSKPSVSPSKPASSSGSWWGSSSRPSSSSAKSNKASSVDSKINASVKSTGKTYSSKDSAAAAFKSKYSSETGKGGKYTAKYDKEPATRPSHIPTTTSVGGQNVNITYNSGMGGYGYYHPSLGTWMMYDALTDAAMMSTLMHREGYVVGHAGGGTTVVHTATPGYSMWGFVIFILVAVLLFSAVIIIARSQNQE